MGRANRQGLSGLDTTWTAIGQGAGSGLAARQEGGKLQIPCKEEGHHCCACQIPPHQRKDPVLGILRRRSTRGAGGQARRGLGRGTEGLAEEIQLTGKAPFMPALALSWASRVGRPGLDSKAIRSALHWSQGAMLVPQVHSGSLCTCSAPPAGACMHAHTHTP